MPSLLQTCIGSPKKGQQSSTTKPDLTQDSSNIVTGHVISNSSTPDLKPLILSPPPNPKNILESIPKSLIQEGMDPKTKCPIYAITPGTISKVLKQASENKKLASACENKSENKESELLNPFCEETVTDQPVAGFYDLDVFDYHMQELKNAFENNIEEPSTDSEGNTKKKTQFCHMLAAKGMAFTSLLQHAHTHFKTGVECASIGELLHALNHVQVCDKDHVVFDSPCKTYKELEFAIEQGIYLNLDNFDEYERAKEIVEKIKKKDSDTGTVTALGPIGFRINPLVGAGKVAALSVSTSDSKFGTPITVENREKMLKCYLESPLWMNSVHVHVGSGGMGEQVLAKGVQIATEFAKEINQKSADTNGNNTTTTVTKQVRYLDIGGGLPPNYHSDHWSISSNDDSESNNAPSYTDYANYLKQLVPDLFNNYFDRILTEFGQSAFTKCGFLASKIEFYKTNKDVNPIIVGHFGGDSCVRAVYTNGDHDRRVECFKDDGEEFEELKESGYKNVIGNGKDESLKLCEEYNNSVKEISNIKSLIPTNVAGPLCFQGDFLRKNVPLPSTLKAGDYMVFKDTGANTLALFSFHCSRLMPAVYGYRRRRDTKGDDEKIEFCMLSRKGTMGQIREVWG